MAFRAAVHPASHGPPPMDAPVEHLGEGPRSLAPAKIQTWATAKDGPIGRGTSPSFHLRGSVPANRTVIVWHARTAMFFDSAVDHESRRSRKDGLRALQVRKTSRKCC